MNYQSKPATSELMGHHAGELQEEKAHAKVSIQSWDGGNWLMAHGSWDTQPEAHGSWGTQPELGRHDLSLWAVCGT